MNLVGRHLHLGDENVQASSAFECRAMGGVAEPATILGRVLTVALGNIECDGSGCPVQLVLDLTDSTQAVQDRREPSYESDCFLIDLKLFVIKPVYVWHL